MSEKDFARDFCLLTKSLHPVRIENALATPGLPDVSIAPGFVELKWARAWPKKHTTPLRIDHYTDDQRHWLLRRAAAGGGAWLALKVRSEWFIFCADSAQQVGFLTRQELTEQADAYFPVKPSAEELCRVFTGEP